MLRNAASVHGRRVTVAVALLLVVGAGPVAAEPETGCDASRPRIAGRIDSVSADGELRLADGPVLRLADLRLRRGGAPHDPRALAWLGTLAGTAIRYAPIAEPDRWGAVAAVVETDEARPIDLVELAVAEGLALVDPGSRPGPCRPALLRLEDEARRSRRGGWARPDAVLPASDPAAIRRASGTFAVVEGRVLSVGERRDRTYLNFGRDFSRDFAVVIPRRLWNALKATGWSADTLRGTGVRVRGVVEERRAPFMELTGSAMLERQDAAAPSR